MMEKVTAQNKLTAGFRVVSAGTGHRRSGMQVQRRRSSVRAISGSASCIPECRYREGPNKPLPFPLAGPCRFRLLAAQADKRSFPAPLRQPLPVKIECFVRQAHLAEHLPDIGFAYLDKIFLVGQNQHAAHIHRSGAQ